MKQVDELIRGELSAVESIQKILPKLNDESEKTELTSMMQDHVRAVDTLKKFVGANFKADTRTSGPWGAFAKAFTGGASLFGDKAALNALKVGEEYGIKEYQMAMEDRSIDPNLKSVINSELLPNQQRHVEIIDRYLQ